MTVAITRQAIDENPGILLTAIERVGGLPVRIEACPDGGIVAEDFRTETCAIHISREEPAA